MLTMRFLAAPGAARQQPFHGGGAGFPAEQRCCSLPAQCRAPSPHTRKPGRQGRQPAADAELRHGRCCRKAATRAAGMRAEDS